MNPIPMLLLLTVASLIALFALALRELRGAYRRRERLLCPVRLRRVRVLFRLWPDGEPADVIRCSVFGRRPVTCGKVCLGAQLDTRFVANGA
jgi:hypothetical protein